MYTYFLVCGMSVGAWYSVQLAVGVSFLFEVVNILNRKLSRSSTVADVAASFYSCHLLAHRKATLHKSVVQRPPLCRH